MEDMKILYISYAKAGSGGGVHTEQFFSALKGLHRNVGIFPPLPEKEHGSSKPAMRESRNKAGPFGGVKRVVSSFVKKMPHEARMLRIFKPDVVVLRAGGFLSSLLLCRLLKIPSILEVNGPVLENRLIAKNPTKGLAFWEWMEKNVALKLPTHVTVVSEPLRHYYIRRGIPPSRITTVPNGVDTNRFHPWIEGQAVRRKLGLTDKTVIGFSGSFAPWHGLDFLLQAVRKLIRDHPEMEKSVALLLIGRPGPYYSMPEAKADFMVTTGHVPYEEMPLYLAAIDIFVAPYPRIEPFYFSPLKIFEAMAVGKPVIASAQGQIKELITDGVSGFLYPPGDTGAFLDKLRALIRDGELRKKAGRMARRRMEEQFTWEHNARLVLKLCSRMARPVSSGE